MEGKPSSTIRFSLWALYTLLVVVAAAWLFSVFGTASYSAINKELLEPEGLVFEHQALALACGNVVWVQDSTDGPYASGGMPGFSTGWSGSIHLSDLCQTWLPSASSAELSKLPRVERTRWACPVWLVGSALVVVVLTFRGLV